jgi:hypothetical protein
MMLLLGIIIGAAGALGFVALLVVWYVLAASEEELPPPQPGIRTELEKVLRRGRVYHVPYTGTIRG